MWITLFCLYVLGCCAHSSFADGSAGYPILPLWILCHGYYAILRLCLWLLRTWQCQLPWSANMSMAVVSLAVNHPVWISLFYHYVCCLAVCSTLFCHFFYDCCAKDYLEHSSVDYHILRLCIWLCPSVLPVCLWLLYLLSVISVAA